MNPGYRRTRRAAVAALAALIAFVSSCSKKQSSSGGDPIVAPPGSVTSDHLLIVHYRASEVRKSALFNEMKEGMLKSVGGGASWEDFEKQIEGMLGARLSYAETLIFCIPDAPKREQDLKRFLLIIACDAPIPKDSIFRKGQRPAPGLPGFHQLAGEMPFANMLIHFPDEKTIVFLHPDLADRYAAGYAKDRNAWPMSEAFKKAAEQHTLLAVGKPSMLPADARKGRDIEPFVPLFDAKSLSISADLQGKTIHIGVRGSFADEHAAKRGKDALARLAAEASEEFNQMVNEPRQAEDLGPALAVVKEAHRAIVAANIDVNGSDLVATTTYKADFDIAGLIGHYVKQVNQSAIRLSAQNNLKQIGLGLHSYHDAHNWLPISGVGKNGVPIRDPNGKPLLSWRVAILPFLEEGTLYKEFKLDEPWDSDHNKKLIERMPKIFQSTTTKTQPGMTHFQQIIGPTCMLPGRYTIGQIPDGSSNTIAVAEAAEPVIWTKPDDLYFSEKELNAPAPKDLKSRFGGQFPNGFNVLLWDGSVRFLDSRIPASTLWNLLRPADGNVTGDY